MTEAELLEHARTGDQQACRELVVQHEAIVAAVVIGMLGQGDDADDVGQETFIRFFRSLGSFRGEAAVATYLQRIAINLSLNALKRRKRMGRRLVPLDPDVPPPSAATDPAREHAARDAHEQVYAALDQLSEQHRPVVVLRMIEGLSTRETAERLSLPEGTVLSRLARAMERLERILREQS